MNASPESEYDDSSYGESRSPRPAGARDDPHSPLFHGAGLADRSDVGRLRIEGKDALDLLNRLTTNAVLDLPPGHARSTVLTNGDARVIDLLHLGALDDHLLCLTSPGRQQAVIDWLDLYTFGEEIAVVDRTGETAQLTLAGPDAAQVLSVTGADVSRIPMNGLREVVVGDARAVAWRTTTGGAPGFEVIVEAASAKAARDALLRAGAVTVPAEAWETYRVANGMPVYGAEFGDHTNPLESRLRGAISFDKGCYTGQEVIARLDTYQKVQRRLMALALSGRGVGALLAAPRGEGAASGAPTPAYPDLLADGKRAGVVTSVAQVADGRWIGLALVATKLAEPGRVLDVGGSGVTARLAEPAYALATEPSGS